MIILDKTGTVTEGSRSAVAFIPLQSYTEQDVAQAAFAASIHDTTHEGKSIVDLAEEKKFIPSKMERILAARPIEFTAETRYGGIELIPSRKELTREQADTIASLRAIGNGVAGKVDRMLEEFAKSNASAYILKGSIDTIIPLAENVNEAELRWKAQEISKSGGTPLELS